MYIKKGRNTHRENSFHCREFIGLAHTITLGFRFISLQDGATCLFLAAQNGHAKVVALILAAVTTPIATTMINNRRLDGATPLWMAAQMGYDHVIRLLLRAGANPELGRNVKNRKRSISIDLRIVDNCFCFIIRRTGYRRC